MRDRVRRKEELDNGSEGVRLIERREWKPKYSGEREIVKSDE